MASDGPLIYDFPMSTFDLATETGAAAEQRMRTELVGWLTTVARDGTPQSSPVAFLWDGEVITIWSETERPQSDQPGGEPSLLVPPQQR